MLHYLHQLEVTTARPRQLLGKTIFLLALASGARLCELVALSRGTDHIQFLESGVLKLFPQKTFLAKNELPTDRGSPIRIPPLPPGNKALCPVHTLKVYLERTDRFKSGQLFRNITSGAPLCPTGIRSQLVALIKASNPDTFPTMHTIRKLTMSCSLLLYGVN